MRTKRRLLRAEKLITLLLYYWSRSEHGNVEDTIQQMRFFIQES